MDNNFKKYSRQLLFWPEGEHSQAKLAKKVVTIIGVGALGTAIANLLVRSGVGEIRIVDRDFVEESNLQRQILFDESDAKNHLPKAIAAKNKLSAINSEVKVIPYIEDLNSTNIESIVSGSDLIFDGTDNMMARFLINDVSMKHNIPWVYGGVVQSRGMTTTIVPNKTPCFRCLFPHAEAGLADTCDTVGVISTVVQIIASYQATEGLKLLIGDHQNLRQEMIQLDVWKNDFDEFPFQQSLNEACPCCQQKQFQFLESNSSNQLITSLCGRNTIQISSAILRTVDLEGLYQKWSRLGTVKKTPYLLRLEYEEYQLSLFPNGRLLVQGTDNFTIAKRLYSSLVGE